MTSGARRAIECDVAELRTLLDQPDQCAIIDVREYPEFAAGRIAGSRLIPLSEVERRAGEIDRERAVYLVCRTGRRSAEAHDKLRSLGFTNIRSLKGGLVAWEEKGLPVEKDERAPWALERQVRLVAGSLVLIGVLLSVFVAQPFIWLAGFVGAGLAFAAITDTCAMGMMLAKLPWNRRK